MIYIQQAILHILDINTNEPIYSLAGLDITEKFTLDYIHAMIEKVEDSDNMKEGTLPEDSPVVGMLANVKDDFVAATRALNYSDSITHHVSQEDDTLTNHLIVNRAILPSARQAIQEGMVLNLESMQYHVLEKKHMITELAEKRFYFTEMFLEDEPKPSLKENIAMIKKAVQKTSKAFNDEEFVALAETKQALVHSMEEENVIDNQVVADRLFGDNYAKKEKFFQEVEELGYVDRAPAEVAVAGPKFSKQKLRLDNGIEISIPMDLYQDAEVVEFINNPDGTISVMIKNIEKIKNLF